MSRKVIQRKIHFESFEKRTKPLQHYEDIGEGVFLSYAEDTLMRIYSEVKPISTSSNVPALVLSSETRTSEDWLSLVIDTDAECLGLTVHMRYAPAESLYLAAIGFRDGTEERIGLETVVVPDHDFRYKIDVPTILPRFAARPNQIRFMMLLPTRPWFYLGLQSVEEIR